MDNSGNVLCFDRSYVRTVIFSVEGYTLVNTKQANLCSYALSKSSVRSNVFGDLFKSLDVCDDDRCCSCFQPQVMRCSCCVC